LKSKNRFLEILRNEGIGNADLEKKGIRLDSRDVLCVSAESSSEQVATVNTFTNLHRHENYDDDNALSQIMETHWPRRDQYLERCASNGALLLDVGCGPAAIGRRFFASALGRGHYFGLEAGDHIEVARQNLRAIGAEASFIQCDVAHFPVTNPVFDFALIHGVLHHTDSIENSLAKISRTVKSGGGIAISINKRLPLVSRLLTPALSEELRKLSATEFQNAISEITKIGQIIDRCNAEVTIESDFDFLEIPKGKYNLHRLLHYYFMRMFYNEKWGLERSTLQNVDWYEPIHSHTVSPEELSSLVESQGMEVVELNFPTPSAISLFAVKN
tara:strand:- start:1072 stop:2061 length:990 start_codon:yes stop_codon:yes gene_type:complete